LRASLRAFFATLFGADAASPAGITASGGDPGGFGWPGDPMSGVGNDLGPVTAAPAKTVSAAAAGMAGGGRAFDATAAEVVVGGGGPFGGCGNALASADKGGWPAGGCGNAPAAAAAGSRGGGASLRVSRNRVSRNGGGLLGIGVFGGNCGCRGCLAFSTNFDTAASSCDLGGVGLGGSTSNVGQGT
jgi:hypothetical protein